MTRATIAGRTFDLEPDKVVERAADMIPEPIHEHFAIVGGRRFPPKQVLAAVTGVDRADFTTHQARAILRRLGFGVHRRKDGHPMAPPPSGDGPMGGAERALLTPFVGRWIAQVGLEILFDADSPEEVVAWLRRHGRRATVWGVPASPEEAGSTLSTP